MTGFNLPPGCETYHIPGNRPEDEAEEAFWDALENHLSPEAISSAPAFWYELTWVQDVVNAARDIAWKAGFEDGKAEQQIAEFNTQTSRHIELDNALHRVNGPFSNWKIKFCEDNSGTWYEAKDEDTQFMRANLEDLVQVCLILNGEKKP